MFLMEGLEKIRKVLPLGLLGFALSLKVIVKLVDIVGSMESRNFKWPE